MKSRFDLRAERPLLVFDADIGWVTGHTYIAYGPLACGATEIVFEGVPTYPDAGRFWKVIQDHKVTHLLHHADSHAVPAFKAADNDRRGADPKNYDLPRPTPPG